MGDDGRGDTSNIIAYAFKLQRFLVVLIERHSGINFSIGQAFNTTVRRPSVINISVRILAGHFNGCSTLQLPGHQ